MKVEIQKLPKSQVELKIEIPAEEFNRFRETTLLNLGKDLEIQGFRKGKAPKDIIEREIGSEKILAETAEKAIKENYIKAIRQLAEENKIEAISQPEIKILKLVSGTPFVFQAKTSVLPEVKLPDYQKIASQVQRKEVSVSKEEIERLKLEKERVEKERARQEILEKIAQDSEIEIPEILIELEKKRMLEGLKKQVPQMLQVSFEDYLKKLGKTEKEILESFKDEAQRRTKNSLILREIGKKEKISVSPQEIQEELKKISQGSPNIEEKFDLERLKDYAKEVLLSEKTFQFLESCSNK